VACHDLLQLGSDLAPLAREVLEQRPERGVAEVLGGRLESPLAVTAGRDEGARTATSGPCAVCADELNMLQLEAR
jgi:hypothetical protein